MRDMSILACLIMSIVMNYGIPNLVFKILFANISVVPLYM